MDAQAAVATSEDKRVENLARQSVRTGRVTNGDQPATLCKMQADCTKPQTSQAKEPYRAAAGD